MGVRVGLVLLFLFLFFLFSCFRCVLGLIFVHFNLFCFFFSMSKDRALFTMYQHVCIWQYYDMVLISK